MENKRGGREGGRVRIERIGKRRRVTEKSGVKYSDERGIIKNSSTTFALERISRTDVRVAIVQPPTPGSSVIAPGHHFFHRQAFIIFTCVCAKPEKERIFSAYSTAKEIRDPSSLLALLRAFRTWRSSPLTVLDIFHDEIENGFCFLE